MYKIEKSRFIQKVLICFSGLGAGFLISLGYFLGFDITLYSIIMYFTSLICTGLLCFGIYLILKRFSNNIFFFYSNKIIFSKNESIEKTIQIEDIIKIRYIRTIWMLLSQMGASYLIIDYSENKKVMKEYISMSKKEAKKVGKILNINIEIK